MKRMSKDNKPSLDDLLCFPIYVASRRIIQRYNRSFGALGLTYPQYLVLIVLWEDEEMTVSSIGKRLHLDSGTLTPLLKRMESKGLITRHRCTVDERTVIISLTDTGKQMQKKVMAAPTQLAKDIPLTEDEMLTLKALMYKLIDRDTDK